MSRLRHLYTGELEGQGEHGKVHFIQSSGTAWSFLVFFLLFFYIHDELWLRVRVKKRWERSGGRRAVSFFLRGKRAAATGEGGRVCDLRGLWGVGMAA